MAINEIKKDSKSIAELEGLLFNINNGDLSVLEKIKEKWKFKDKEGVFRFALAVMVQAENSTLYIQEKNEKKALIPGEGLIVEDKKKPE
ncbi:hypothetical protein KAT63_01800 [Candidatus Parcubacteria bacterium]|nr:hypothetical protein [Candidatus Parcubacteria bacterium]